MIHKISIFLKQNFPKLIWKYAPFIWRGNTDSSTVGLQKLFSGKESISEVMLLEEVLSIAKRSKGVEFICELGSGAGRNLFYLSKNLTYINYIGFDINRALLRGGSDYLRAHYQDSVIELKEADIESISLVNYNIDILFTSMTLIYIHPDKISQVIENIAINSRKGVIVQEIQGTDSASNPFAGYLHDYDKLFLDLNLYVDFDIEKSIINSSAWMGMGYTAYQYTLIRR